MTTPAERLVRCALSVLLLALPTSALAFDGRVTDAGGNAVRGANVMVSGRSGHVRTDQNGRFTILPDPDVPITLIIVGEKGEVYPPMRIESLSGQTIELRLEPLFSESVTVTSGAAPTLEAPPAVATTMVGSEEMEQRKPQHLIDAVERIPGVSRRGEGPSAVPVVRGLAGGRTLLMLDDSRIVSERRAGPSGSFLNPFSLAAIDIARGPGSVAYGSDAIGGVIHARPRDPARGKQETRFDLWGSTESEQVISGSIEYSDDLAGGAFLVSAHARKAGDSSDGDGDPIANSSYSDRGAAFRFVTDNNLGRFRIGFAADQSRDVGAPASDSNINRTYYPDENSYRLTGGADLAPRFGFSLIEIRGSLGSYGITTNRERLPVGTTTRQISSAEVEASDATLRVSASRLTKTGRLVAGVDFVTRFGLEAIGEVQAFDLAGNRGATTSEVSIESATKRDLGVFSIYERQFTPRLTASGGVRIDYVTTENRGGHFGDRGTDDSALSGHLAVTGGLPANFDASLQISTGYREPSLSDRYFRGISGRGFVIGNPDLNPERSYQVDGSLRRNGRTHSVALFAYDYRIDNLVERYRSGNDFLFRNRGEASIRGIELEGEARFGLGMALQAGAAIARGKAVDDDRPLDDIAPLTAHATLRRTGKKTSLFVSATAYARDDRPGPLEVERPGYMTLDLGAGWHVRRGLELRLMVRNATDRFYAGSADAAASFATGRSITIGINSK